MQYSLFTHPVRFGTATLFAAAIAATGCRGWVSEAPPVHLNQNMDTQEKLKPYRASEFFANGRAMQTPREGTVARSLTGEESRDAVFLRADKHYVEGKVGGALAGALPPSKDFDEAAILRGQERYNIYCAPCHAQDGAGGGTVARRLTTKPPTFHQQRIYDLKPGDIFNTITHGKNWPNMAPYGDQVKVDDRWNIVFYLRALMQTQNPGLKPYRIGSPAVAFAALADPMLARFDGEKSIDAMTLDEKIAAALQGKVIEFASGSATLTAKGKAVADIVFPLIEASPLWVRIDGHTDSTGDSAANQALSQRRSQAVKAYYVSKGIAKERLFNHGFGQDRPIADNGTEEGRQRNRRIEFKSVDPDTTTPTDTEEGDKEKSILEKVVDTVDKVAAKVQEKVDGKDKAPAPTEKAAAPAAPPAEAPAAKEGH